MADIEEVLEQTIANALDEDLGLSGDITTQAVFHEDKEVSARIIAREPGTIAGLFVAAATFKLIDKNIGFVPLVDDGDEVSADEVVAEIKGNIVGVLSGERVALNFIAHLSGVATLTRKFVERAASHGVSIKDTRKTLPGLRIFEKYAVEVGGGRHHRFGLYDGVLIKDNHIKAAGGLEEAVTSARANLEPGTSIEVEAATLDEVAEALSLEADIIMLDNMDADTMREAVRMINGDALVEVSGSVTLETVEKIAELGVNYISVGALTQSAPALDVSLEIE